jgi:hypothetical protein
MVMEQVLNNVVEDLNTTFDGFLIAEIRNDLLVLSLVTRKHIEPWQLEEQLGGALEYVIERYDVDFNVVGYGKRSVAYEIYSY